MAGAAPEQLPAILPEATRIYLRPVGLSCGNTADKLMASGDARRLAGGPWVFAACEVVLRLPDGLRRALVGLREVVAWSKQLQPPWRNALDERLKLLIRDRAAPGGGPLARPMIMGVVNATPDSFSDSGRHLDARAVAAHGRQLAAEGADILDVGGESTRPGAEPVAQRAEMDRVLPVLKGLSNLYGVRLSIDTRRAEVMAAALDAGVTMINDVTALAGDPLSLQTAAASDAAVVLMHMQGEPPTMNVAPAYEDTVLDIFDFLEARIAACLRAGIPRERLIVDPGIGFGKTGADNLEILRQLSVYHGLGCPILIGVSRKGLTGDLDRARPPKERLPGSLTAAVRALDQGVQILRVHDVAETRQAVDVWERLVGLEA